MLVEHSCRTAGAHPEANWMWPAMLPCMMRGWRCRAQYYRKHRGYCRPSTRDRSPGWCNTCRSAPASAPCGCACGGRVHRNVIGLGRFHLASFSWGQLRQFLVLCWGVGHVLAMTHALPLFALLGLSLAAADWDAPLRSGAKEGDFRSCLAALWADTCLPADIIARS